MHSAHHRAHYIKKKKSTKCYKKYVLKHFQFQQVSLSVKDWVRMTRVWVSASVSLFQLKDRTYCYWNCFQKVCDFKASLLIYCAKFTSTVNPCLLGSAVIWGTHWRFCPPSLDKRPPRPRLAICARSCPPGPHEPSLPVSHVNIRLATSHTHTQQTPGTRHLLSLIMICSRRL